MITALNKNKKRLSRRASQPSAERLYPPEGSPLIKVSYVRWQFFTGKGEGEWDSIFLSEDDAEWLCRSLDKSLGFLISGS